MRLLAAAPADTGKGAYLRRSEAGFIGKEPERRRQLGFVSLVADRGPSDEVGDGDVERVGDLAENPERGVRPRILQAHDICLREAGRLCQLRYRKARLFALKPYLLTDSTNLFLCHERESNAVVSGSPRGRQSMARSLIQ